MMDVDKKLPRGSFFHSARAREGNDEKAEGAEYRRAYSAAAGFSGNVLFGHLCWHDVC
jgi:hypothetical protein